MPLAGCQETFLSCSADIIIYGGKRGAGKTGGILLDALKDYKNKHFNAVIFRKEINDLETIERESEHFYSQFGDYNKSKNDMTWKNSAKQSAPEKMKKRNAC